jgi:predicted transcriptional regulator
MKEDRTMMEKETKEERFKRIAEKRVQNIIHAIRNLSGLSNKKVYEWETEQLEKIWKAIDKEVENCKDSFKNPDSKIFKL